ncbi:MAG: hypothetical protein AVO35_03040 [Candidatus Aegiribacteria sp. MLS_C]|nr:MAG: hypothetical protein AVO35_03040 [Candidatus Aegiribacteria sp. MLS_C]
MTAEEFREKLAKALEQAVREIPSRYSERDDWMPLTEEQASFLETRGCRCDDWSGVFVSPGSDLGAVTDCRFFGRVRLTLEPAVLDGSARLPMLRGSGLEDVVVGPGCRVIDTGILSGMVLEECVTVERCGRIGCAGGSLFGSLRELELGVETGERNVPSSPLLDMETASLLSGGETRRSLLEVYRSTALDLADLLRGMDGGVLGSGCSIKDTSVVENTLVGPGAAVDNARAVRNSTLMAGSSVRDGALVRDSILRWSCTVDSMAFVDGSVVDEASMVEKHGKLTASYLGPNSVLGEGEITSSLAGPFTACHHQALLIAARWPEGRGNIGYGANVGSNHTSRLPDQEIRPGEGMFFGLACSVKFPADFHRAPYSIIATGVTTLPQRVEFPFSLICEPFRRIDGVPPAWNQIIPGWVLSDNMFAVLRNDAKYRERNRAVHWKPPDAGIVRAETVQLMLDALDRLDVEETRSHYTEDQIPGLGRNFLTEEHRLAAVRTYRFHADLFALETMDSPSATEMDRQLSESVMGSRYSGYSRSRLEELRSSMREDLARSVEESRSRDHRRGVSIIDDYALVRGIHR